MKETLEELSGFFPTHAESAEDNILPLLESRVVDHVLYLGPKTNTNISTTQPIEFIIEVKQLDALTVSGSGNVEAKRIDSQHFEVSVSGVGNVMMEGKAGELNIRLSGTGNFQGEEFITKRATVTISGLGNVVVNVSDSLNADMSGVGSVEYIGSPQVHQSVSGLGRVKKR